MRGLFCSLLVVTILLEGLIVADAVKCYHCEPEIINPFNQCKFDRSKNCEGKFCIGIDVTITAIGTKEIMRKCTNETKETKCEEKNWQDLLPIHQFPTGVPFPFLPDANNISDNQMENADKKTNPREGILPLIDLRVVECACNNDFCNGKDMSKNFREGSRGSGSEMLPGSFATTILVGLLINATFIRCLV